MAYKIDAVDVVASYDAMTRNPGEMRPLPTLVSARLLEEVSEDVDMQSVIHDASHAALNAGDLTSALHEARTKVAQFMNQHVIANRVQGIEIDATSPQYIPTSNGGHNTVAWLKVGGGKSKSSFWGYKFDIQGETIHAYACVLITLKVAAATPTPTPGAGTPSASTTTPTTPGHIGHNHGGGH